MNLSGRPNLIVRVSECVVAAAAAVALSVVAVAPIEAAGAASAKKAWRYWITPEEAGFSSEALAEAEELWEAIDDAPVSAFFLVYKGRVLASFGDVKADHECHSVRKSFMSALYGIHVDKGTIDLEATLEELGMDDISPLSRGEKQATVLDLLMARSGVYHDAACETEEMQDARPERGSHAPGTFWYYNNWDFNALGTIFRQETGRDIFREFKKRIGDPIGMQEFKVSRCGYEEEAQYSEHPCYVFRMSARDRARFGQLFLQQGKWGKKQIVPEAWVDESTRGYSNTKWFTGMSGFKYGYMWWVESPRVYRTLFRDRRLHHLRGFSANGNGGQLIMALPDAEMVIVFAVDMNRGGDMQQEETTEMLETILTGRDIVDLKVKQAQARERVLSAGDTLHLTAKIKNNYAVPTLATAVEFYLAQAGSTSDEIWRLGTAPLIALAAKKGKTVRLEVAIPSGVAPGRYRVFASVDADKANYDLRRTNNLKAVKGSIEIR